MKKIFCTFLAGGLLLSASCKKEALLTYKAEDSIYFKYIVGARNDGYTLGRFVDGLDLTFSFSDASVTDSILAIPVAVSGVASNHDRAYRLTVDPASTARPNQHYELPASFLIKAGQVDDTIRIRFKRTADIKTSLLSMKLALQENDQFNTKIQFRPGTVSNQTQFGNNDTVQATTFQVTIGDMLSAGPYWATQYEYTFGTFSEKKVRLMNQITGMPLSFWSKPANTAQDRSEMVYYGGLMARYLSDQAFAGNIILEADGITPMRMGARFL